MALSSAGVEGRPRPRRASRRVVAKFLNRDIQVHGSLARAGKVKGQTPKVEKQEKKKLPTGRAKKRMLYNRRFVNVVAGVGGKRFGPNSNAAKA